MPSTSRSLAWDDLRLVGAVAQAGTLPAAAQRLGLDHSTVFRRLRQIEATLGAKLFERHREGYVPTTTGAEIVALGGRVEDDINTVLRRVAGQSLSPAGEVRVATSDVLLSDLITPLLPGFQAACPDVRLEFVTGNTAVNLSRRDADIAIRATVSPPETLVGRKTARLAWAAYAAGPAGGIMTEAALAAQEAPWVGFADALAGLAGETWLRTHIPAPAIRCRFDTVAGIASGIAAGLGYGLLPCFLGERAGLARLTAPIAAIQSDLWLLTHADLRHVPRIRVLLDYLAERIAAQREQIEGSAF